MTDRDWSAEYDQFSDVLDRVQRQAATDDIEPSRHGDEYRVDLQYENSEDDWADELRGKADEIERLKRHLSPDFVNVRTYPDMTEVFLKFELGEGGE